MINNDAKKNNHQNTTNVNNEQFIRREVKEELHPTSFVKTRSTIRKRNRLQMLEVGLANTHIQKKRKYIITSCIILLVLIDQRERERMMIHIIIILFN
jgi:hypothetical protein